MEDERSAPSVRGRLVVSREPWRLARTGCCGCQFPSWQVRALSRSLSVILIVIWGAVRVDVLASWRAYILRVAQLRPEAPDSFFEDERRVWAARHGVEPLPLPWEPRNRPVMSDPYPER